MTREEAVKKINAIKKHLTAGKPIWDVREIQEDLSMAIEALQYEPSKDLISRADAVKKLLLFKQSRARIVSRYDIGFEDGLSQAINMLGLVPLVYIPSINIENIEAEPKTGEWIEHIGGISHELYYFCDQCYGEVDTNNYNFCPNCGADMRGK